MRGTERVVNKKIVEQIVTKYPRSNFTHTNLNNIRNS